MLNIKMDFSQIKKLQDGTYQANRMLEEINEKNFSPNENFGTIIRPASSVLHEKEEDAIYAQNDVSFNFRRSLIKKIKELMGLSGEE